MNDAADYAELHCLSNFSFLRAASHPEELVGRAAALGYRAIALTDECSLAGVVRAHAAARTQDIQLIIGSEFHLDDGLHLVLLAPDRRAYGRLSALISLARSQAKKGAYRLSREDLQDGLPGCLALMVVEPTTSPEAASWVAETFIGRAWVTCALRHDGHDRERLAHCQALGRRYRLPAVASGGVTMHRRGRRALRDTLQAIRQGSPVRRISGELSSNGEGHLRPRHTLTRLYPAEMLAESLRIARHCHFSLDELRYEYPEELIGEGHTPTSWLRELVEQGGRERWPEGMPERVRQAVEHELALIHELAYEPYFLTVHDIVAFARSRGILCQGRGSAANSAVCYCLGITSVDPVRSSLLFERFISRERREPPDIDVDFEHDRREEVIQYIYQKYGRHRAALAATVICYRPRSALRDVGKALGLETDQIERLTRTMQWWDGRHIAPERLREAGFDPDNAMIQRLLSLVHEIIGFPRHLSQHVGGFVISQGPLSELVPTEDAAMAGRSIIQWDKDDLETLGLLKVDCLALGMLSAIRRSFDLIEQHHGRRLGLADIPAEDPGVYDMLCRADTMGVFQVESRAQMAMLPRLRPRCFYDLVIEISIVRPGPFRAIWCIPTCVGVMARKPSIIPAMPYAGCWSALSACQSSRNRSCSLPSWRPASRPVRPINCAGPWPHGKNAGVWDPFVSDCSRAWPSAAIHPLSPNASSSRSADSESTGFPNLTRRALLYWFMSRHGLSITTRLFSSAPCSTANPWAFMRRLSWFAMRAPMALKSVASMSVRATGTAHWSTTRLAPISMRCGLACA